MANNDMLGVRSGRDADEAPLAAEFLCFRLAIAGISWSLGFPRWRKGINVLRWVKDRVTSLRTKYKLIFKQSYLNTGTSYE